MPGATQSRYMRRAVSLPHDVPSDPAVPQCDMAEVLKGKGEFAFTPKRCPKPFGEDWDGRII